MRSYFRRLMLTIGLATPTRAERWAAYKARELETYEW